MTRLLLLVVPIAVLAGCKTQSPNYCPDGMCGNPPGDGSSGGHCTGDSDCDNMPGFPACELMINQGTCKQCTKSNHTACMGTTPRCENNACVACVDDKDCDGGAGVCLATGDCAVTSHIIHASSLRGNTSNCGDGVQPACSLVGALMMAMPGKDVVKLDDVGPFLANGFMVTNDVTIDARVNGGATLSRADNGPVISVTGGKSLTLLGGIIEGTIGKNGDGIVCNTGSAATPSTLVAVDTKVENNDQSGINADTCTLNLTRVTVNNNSQKAGAFAPSINVNKGSIKLAQSRIDSNNGGGISVTNAVFQIVGNVFSNNGPSGVPDPQNPVGGIFITAPGNPANRLDFNTITGNHAQAGGPGLQCMAGNLIVRNNIIYNNNDNLGAQFGGNCQPAYSDLGFITIDMNNNMHVDPMFTTGSHLSATSPLLGKADPNADLTGIAAKDIDGEARVAPADIGADQYHAPQ